jgi:hypothetical protein
MTGKPGTAADQADGRIAAIRAVTRRSGDAGTPTTSVALIPDPPSEGAHRFG